MVGWYRPSVAKRFASFLLLAMLLGCSGLPNPFVASIEDGETVDGWWIRYQNHTPTNYVLLTEDATGAVSARTLAGCLEDSFGLGALQAPFQFSFDPGTYDETQIRVLFTSDALPAVPGAAGYNLVIAEDGSLNWTPLDTTPPVEIVPPLC